MKWTVATFVRRSTRKTAVIQKRFCAVSTVRCTIERGWICTDCPEDSRQNTTTVLCHTVVRDGGVSTDPHSKTCLRRPNNRRPLKMLFAICNSYRYQDESLEKCGLKMILRYVSQCYYVFKFMEGLFVSHCSIIEFFYLSRLGVFLFSSF